MHRYLLIIENVASQSSFDSVLSLSVAPML